MNTNYTPQEQDALLSSPLLTGVDPPLMEDVFAQGTVLDFCPSQVIYTPHHFQQALGILLSGTLQVRREQLSVSTLQPGDLFGAAALYSDEADYTATLTGETAGRILLLDFSYVHQLLGESPLVRENYLRYLTGRIRFLNQRLHSVAAGDGEGKLARHLLSLQGTLDCPATELAKRLGMSRATLYRAFQSLESVGAIQRDGRKILILDSNKLSDFS